jgi:hypothetical protein
MKDYHVHECPICGFLHDNRSPIPEPPKADLTRPYFPPLKVISSYTGGE